MTIPRVRVATMLKAKSVWTFPVVVGSALVALMTLIYFGSIVAPPAHLHDLPVLMVNQDSGSVGKQVAEALTTTPAITQRLSITEVTVAQADSRMNHDEGEV